MTRIPIDGASYEVDDAGVGAALMLLHGFTGTTGTWADQLETLRASRRTIALDLLGHGRSDAPVAPERYSVEAQAADMVALLQEIDAVPATVMGYSMGARIALTMATQHPDSVHALVLESPSAGIADPAQRAARRSADARLAEMLERDGIGAFVDAWEAQPLFASQAALDDERRSRIREERLAQRPEGLARSLRGGGQGSMSPLQHRLERVRCSSLLIAGADDAAGLQRAHDIVAVLPSARLEIVAGAGHAPHLERASVFNPLVTTFLRDHDPATTAMRSSHAH